MIELLQMWALVELLGIVCLPLTVTVFHNLPDRGWAFSKATGMAVLAFSVWLPLMCFHNLPFSQLFIAGMALIIVALNMIGFLRVRSTITKLIRVNLPYIIVTEIVFLGMVFLLGWIRSYGPDIRSWEMFMDEGFLAAIMRSPHFPPNDMWMSGYSINYYYYAHYTIAMLAKLLGQSPSIAFNTGICTFFGLTAVNLFGVTTNIVARAQHRRKKTVAIDDDTATPDTVYPVLWRAMPFAFFTIIMGLVLGNLAATQEWWRFHGDLPFLYWFDPSRVVDKTINEFPAFSFLLSCFHAHVLALAFTIVAIGLAFNLFLEHDGRGLFVFGRGWRIPFTLGITALMIGGLFTMNGWDFPTYLGLTIVCIGLQQWLAYKGKFRLELILDIFTPVAALTALSFFLYLPFYLNFISPSQGIGIVGPNDRSAISSEILIYGIFAFIVLSLLVASIMRRPTSFISVPSSNSANSVHTDLDVVTLSAIDSVAVGSQGAMLKPSAFMEMPSHPDTTNSASATTVDSDGETDDADEAAKSSYKSPRWLNKWTLGIGFLIGLDLILSGLIHNSFTFIVALTFTLAAVMLMFYHLKERSQAFILLLCAVAFALIAVCEIFYLKDVFADSFPRMNTVFKFYFQCWALFSIASGTGLYFILEAFRPADTLVGFQRRMQRGVEGLWGVGLLLLLFAGMVYPIVGTASRTNNFIQRSNSLDGLTYLQYQGPEGYADYHAIRWINSNISGDPIIVEAIGQDYSDYGRISAFTGLPTIMGWIGHEYQWRVNWLNNDTNATDFNNRARTNNDVDLIYTSSQPQTVLTLLVQYHARYLYVGPLEQEKYPTANLHRFSAFMPIVYSADGVTIYEVP